MVQKPNRKPKYDAIKIRMDLTFDVPAELAEQIELWAVSYTHLTLPTIA